MDNPETHQIHKTQDEDQPNKNKQTNKKQHKKLRKDEQHGAQKNIRYNEQKFVHVYCY